MLSLTFRFVNQQTRRCPKYPSYLFPSMIVTANVVIPFRMSFKGGIFAKDLVKKDLIFLKGLSCPLLLGTEFLSAVCFSFVMHELKAGSRPPSQWCSRLFCGRRHSSHLRSCPLPSISRVGPLSTCVSVGCRKILVEGGCV